MGRNKTIQELTIKNNFMFGAVMCNEKHCRDFLEMVFGFSIARVDVSKEKSLVYHPEYRGVRLDVYANDENNTRYNIEMQAVEPATISKRTRYYHSQIDMDLLTQGTDYTELPNAYVIFVCDFDPFKKKKYCYTFKNICLEDGETELDDGVISIFLSTKGENTHEISKTMVNFLTYVGADLPDSERDFEDDFVKSLQETVASIKADREMEGRYMTLQEMLKDERAEGRAEGLEQGRSEGLAQGRSEGLAQGRSEGIRESVLKVLEEFGGIPEEVKERILSEVDLAVLTEWLVKAAKAENMEQFVKNM